MYQETVLELVCIKEAVLDLFCTGTCGDCTGIIFYQGDCTGASVTSLDLNSFYDASVQLSRVML